jgi:hypothetical protein
MTTERSSYDDPGGVDAIVATREDQMTDAGLDDTAPTTGVETAGGYGSSLGTPATSGTGGDRLQDAAGSVADRVAGTAQERVGSQVDTALTRAGDMIGQLAGAVRQSGDQLRDQQPQVAGFVDTAAGQADRFAEYLRGANVQDVVRQTEDFARRQPAIFLGGALALGLVASRFLKASPSGGSSSGYGFRGGYGYGSSYGSTGYGGGYRSGAGYGSGYGSGYGAGTGYAGTGYAGTGYAGTSGSSGASDYTTGTSTSGTGTSSGQTGVEHGGA